MKKLIKFLSKNRIAVIAGSTLLVLLFGGGIYWGASRYRATRNEAKIIGADLSYAEGAVEIKDQNDDWAKIEKDKDLTQGDSIRVNGDGRAIVTIDDGSAVRLSSNSVVTLTSLDPKHIIITNDLGNVYSRVMKAERIFEVLADGYTYRSLGTAYKTVNTEEEDGVDVYASSVEVRKNDQADSSNIVPEGKKFYFRSKANNNIVTDMAKEEIQKDAFVMWCKEQDEKDDDYKNDLGILGTLTETPEAPPTTLPDQTINAAITLSGYATDSGVKLTWAVNGVDVANGFKVVKSSSINPVYPGNSAVYLKGSTRTYHWSLTDGATYYFRVCQYTGGACGTYSNNIKVTAPKVVSAPPTTETGSVRSITLSLVGVSPLVSMMESLRETAATGQAKMAWAVDGYSPKGFKLVWSKNPSPTYPTRSGDKYNYYSDPRQTTGYVDAFSGSGTYYVRVCEYLGGACGVYSNQVTVTLP